MHALRIVHQDIKPDNFMFSPSFNKLVFIDFGCCRILSQPIGFKTKTAFVGTKTHCSYEMELTYNRDPIHVDLYYNDMYGLSKTLKSKMNSKNA
jgi:serine/threonine protein kinase